MAGYVAMDREWQDHELFAGDEFSRRDAWAWLIAHAAWKPAKARIKGSTVDLQRGDLCFSVRFLAEKWGWSKSRVDRFLSALRAEGMIATRSKIGTLAGQSAGHGQAVLTVCNYSKFQAPLKASRDSEREETGTTAGQQRDKEEEGNKGTIEPKNGSNRASAAETYEFDGRIIRLLPSDFQRWQTAYPDLDLKSRLQSRDDWLATEADEKTRQRWFMSTSNHLAKLQQQAAAERRQPSWDGSA